LAPGWRSNRLVLKSVADDEEVADEVRQAFESMLPDLRMDVHLEVILKPADKTHKEIILEASKDADMVFLGMAIPGPGIEQTYAESLMGLLDGLPSTILVRNASRFHGHLV